MTAPRRDVSLSFLGAVQLVALSADRLKQFSLVAMLGLLAPGSSVELLKLTLFSQIPILLFTPLAGVLIDHWHKARAILTACVARAVILLAVPALFERTRSIETFFLAAFVLSFFDLVFAPARSALLPEVVAGERLLGANAAFWTLGVIGTLLGFVAGGWLFDVFSWQASFHTDALLYLVAGALVLPLALSAPRPAPPAASVSLRAASSFFHRSVRDALALLRESRELRASLAAQAALFAVGGLLSIVGIARIQEVAPDGSARFLSQVGSSFIGGLVAGAFVALPFRDTRLPERATSVGAMVAGVAVAGLGRSTSLAPLCVWAALLGAAISPVFVVTETLMQNASPRQFTGRVFAAREGVIKAAYIVAAVVATVLDALLGKTRLLVGLGLFLALSGVILERTRWLRAQDSEKP